MLRHQPLACQTGRMRKKVKMRKRQSVAYGRDAQVADETFGHLVELPYFGETWPHPLRWFYEFLLGGAPRNPRLGSSTLHTNSRLS